MLISGPAVGAAQMLIWSYSCVFLPPMSTAIRTSVCFFVCLFFWWEFSMIFFIFHRHRVFLVDCMDLICSLYSWWEGLGSSSLATPPLGFNCGFISTSPLGHPQGLLLRLPWRTWACSREGQMWRWCSCLGRTGSGSIRWGVGG